MAMSMLTLGSSGKSETELVLTLCLGKVENIHDETQKLIQAIIKPVDGVDLTTANSVFPERTYDVKKDFISQVKQYYGVDVTPLSFKNEANESREAINKWVSQETKDKIQNLLAEGLITANTKLVLANAIYFKGNWETPFDRAETVDQDFHVSPQKVTKVKIMTQESRYILEMNEELKASILEIPYNGDSITMVIVLPVDKFGLDFVEKNIKPIDVQNADYLYPFKEKVVLGLPKFKLEFGSDLVESFKALGTETIFSDNADLSKVSDYEDLCVSAIAHRALVEVNEEGTEAAAATLEDTNNLFSLTPTPKIICDHPFMFFIKHKPTDTILFSGRFVNPEQ